ncbi:MAG: S24 family peptidase [Patescibacteria group bacterium]|jgi:repressor LexA
MRIHPIQEKLLKIVPKINLKKMSLRDIGLLVEESHPQKISHHLSQLEKKGFIETDKKTGEVRLVGLKTKQSNNEIVVVPIYGAADCGEAKFFAEENLEGYLRVSRRLVGKIKNVFAVRAKGHSMNRAKVNGAQTIEDGDYVLVDPANKNPRNGDYVLSVIEGCANIKKFFLDKKEKQIALVSESTEAFKPIYIHADDDYMINGLVKNVIKSSFFSKEFSVMQDAAGNDALKALGPISEAEADYYRNLK